MRLKLAIQLIRLANDIVFFVVIYLLAIIVFSSGDMKLLVMEALFAVPIIVSLVFRVSLINLYLKKCRYPVAFWMVLSKLGLNRDLDIDWSEEAERDTGRPTYSTSQFLEDNRLKTIIIFKETDWCATSLISPFIHFTEDELIVQNIAYTWQNIYDWRYETGGEDEPDKLFINYYNTDKLVNEFLVSLEKTNANQIDTLLLFAHFKAKYG